MGVRLLKPQTLFGQPTTYVSLSLSKTKGHDFAKRIEAGSELCKCVIVWALVGFEKDEVKEQP